MSDSEAKEIGKIFREAREKRKLSIEDVNRRSRIHINVVEDIENGILTRLNKLYTRSFLKKYADFLGLDADDILRKYEAMSITPQKVEFEVGFQKKKIEEEGKKEGRKFPEFSEKTIQVFLVGALSLIFIFLVFVLIGRVKTKISSSREARAVATTQKEKAAAPVVAKREAPAPPRKTVTKPAKSSSVELTLQARGEVWVKVMEGDETLYVGVIKKGKEKTWKSDKALTVWTGRAEMLNFTVNNQKVGRIADGVVKNIKVSSAGITIDGNWVTRL